MNVNAYPGTKHAVTAITEVLQMEMRHAGLKIKVTVSSNTKHLGAIWDINKFLPLKLLILHINCQILFLQSLSPGICKTSIYTSNQADPETKILKAFPYLEPKDVAEAAIYILSTPPHVLIPELMIKHLGEFV